MVGEATNRWQKLLKRPRYSFSLYNTRKRSGNTRPLSKASPATAYLILKASYNLQTTRYRKASLANFYSVPVSRASSVSSSRWSTFLGYCAQHPSTWCLQQSCWMRGLRCLLPIALAEAVVNMSTMKRMMGSRPIRDFQTWTVCFTSASRK
ncbi:hypothetical protein LY76DRAFT_55656 [Colletotrichum caudatum]|nr:hypothetical protein LY76DRAFT_55656 [Colletotrichum caudatum]